mmetsp:Transcript_13928/g.32662  ORF Transcript_13928/g.32662 Transcript_13928/m.32662 type:complete len:367 (+) Transcript_13928:97-1197(+)
MCEGCSESRGLSVSTSASNLDLQLTGGPEASRADSSCSSQHPQSTEKCLFALEVEPWCPSRFCLEGRLQEAPRNDGQVLLMLDALTGGRVAVKRMPNTWVGKNHTEFVHRHPTETERPWVGMGCAAYLQALAFPYTCPLVGVFRDEKHTMFVTELASGGDLFCAASHSVPPGPAREAQWQPFAVQLLNAVRQLHDLSIVHRDLSPENVLLSRRASDGAFQLQLTDFCMATSSRWCQFGACGKPSYQPPEGHKDEAIDGFLGDTFAVGVTLYATLVGEYPWLSTRPGACKAFAYFRKHGFHRFVKERRLSGRPKKVAQHMSEPLMQLLSGLLAVRLEQRLTLGEADWLCGSARPCVWQERWVHLPTC